MCQVLARFAEDVIQGLSTKAYETSNPKQIFCIHGYCKCNVLIWGHAGKGKRNLALQKWSLGYLLFVTNPGKMTKKISWMPQTSC